MKFETLKKQWPNGLKDKHNTYKFYWQPENDEMSSCFVRYWSDQKLWGAWKIHGKPFQRNGKSRSIAVNKLIDDLKRWEMLKQLCTDESNIDIEFYPTIYKQSEYCETQHFDLTVKGKRSIGTIFFTNKKYRTTDKSNGIGSLYTGFNKCRINQHKTLTQISWTIYNFDTKYEENKIFKTEKLHSMNEVKTILKHIIEHGKLSNE